MAKIKWKTKSETERELKEQEALQKQKEQTALAAEARITKIEETTATWQETMDVVFGG